MVRCTVAGAEGRRRADGGSAGKFNGVIDIATQTIKKEGILALYKGVLLLFHLPRSGTNPSRRNGQSSPRRRWSQLVALRLERRRPPPRFAVSESLHRTGCARGIDGGSGAEHPGESGGDVQDPDAGAVWQWREAVEPGGGGYVPGAWVEKGDHEGVLGTSRFWRWRWELTATLTLQITVVREIPAYAGELECCLMTAEIQMLTLCFPRASTPDTNTRSARSRRTTSPNPSLFGPP